MIDQIWLERINEELSRDNIPVHERDIAAVLRWQRETGEQKDIFAGYPEVYTFFAAMTSPQNPLAEFRGAFFFGGEFWPLNFSITFGWAWTDIDLVIARMHMPTAETERLRTATESRREIAAMIGNCLDWIYGFPRVGSTNSTTFADENLAAADRHLRGAVETLLSERRPSKDASMLFSAHALENVLKAFLAHHAGLEEDGAKELSHKLPKILKRVLASANHSDLDALREPIKNYPNVIKDRYRPVNYTDVQLWEAYRWAQFGAVAVARSVNPGLHMSYAVLNTFAPLR